jgi:integrase
MHIKSRKRNGLAAWCVNVPADLSTTGKRQRLFFTTEKRAKAQCAVLLARRKNFGHSLSSLTPVRIAEAAEAHLLLQPYNISLVDVVRGFIAHRQAAEASRLWRETFDEYLAMPKKRSQKYLRDLNETRKAFRDLNAKTLVEITANDLSEILSRFAPSTQNARMRILRAVFNFGIKRKWLKENPITEMDFAELDRTEVDVFTVDQTVRLLNTAIEHDLKILPFFVFGFFCGIRPDGELQKLQWADVHLSEKQIVIRPSVAKTQRRRFVDISENAIAWIDAYQNGGGVTGGKITPLVKSTLTKRRRELQTKAGITRWIQQGMRHSYCSYWLAMHQDVNKLVLQSGHTDADTMWRHYHRGVTKAEAEKFWAITPPSHR